MESHFPRADNRDRTCTPKNQILNLARLPVPPYPHMLCNLNKRSRKRKASGVQMLNIRS